jgi:hypothetical protein
MNKFRAEIKDFSSHNIIDIRVMYYSKNEPYTFRFNNALKDLEKFDLKIVDSAGKVPEELGYIMINPKNWDDTYAEISQTEPFIYKIEGEIVKLKEYPDHVKFSLRRGIISYLLKKGEKYFIHLQCNEEVSNTIEVQY